MDKVFITDCEGPISKNDNAFEIAELYIPDGGEFFTRVSRYDDFLADVVKKLGYKAGDTLRLILPFLKAYDVTNRKMKEFSSQDILLVPGAPDTLRFVNEIMPSFIVSASYEHYIRALCEVVGFPFQNTYCTKVNMDGYEIGEYERRRLKKIAKEIVGMDVITIPDYATSLKEFLQKDRKIVKRLDEIFWKEIPRMKSGKMAEEVNPIGGSEKANAVKDIARRLDAELCDIMYVGDSITDVDPFQLVREGGGLTVSFNGNSYAIREAEVAVLSGNTIVTSILADVFNRGGKDGVISLVEDWTYPIINDYSLELYDKFCKIFPEELPQVELITKNNTKRLIKESGDFRKRVRGESIGKLG